MGGANGADEGRRGLAPSANPEAQAAFERGCALRLREDIDGAVREYREAIRLDPGFAGARVKLGNALCAKDEHEAAIEAYTEAIALDPCGVDARANRAALYSGLKQYEAALADFAELIRLCPSDTYAFYGRRAEVYEQMGQYHRAIDDYAEMIRLEPGFTRLYITRADACMRANEFGPAIDDYTKAVNMLDAGDVMLGFSAVYGEDIYCRMGNACSALGDNERAIREYTCSIKGMEAHPAPGKLDAEEFLALPADDRKAVEEYLALPENEREAADDDIRTLYSCYEDVESLLYEKTAFDCRYAAVCVKRGNLYAMQGLKDLAASDFKTALENDPESTAAAEALRAMNEAENSS